MLLAGTNGMYLELQDRLDIVHQGVQVASVVKEINNFDDAVMLDKYDSFSLLDSIDRSLTLFATVLVVATCSI